MPEITYQPCGHVDAFKLPTGKCDQCERLDRATAEIEAELKRVEAGDVDAVEAWANDPKVCHGEIEKAALLSLCCQLRIAIRILAQANAEAQVLPEKTVAPGGSARVEISPTCRFTPGAVAAVVREEREACARIADCVAATSGSVDGDRIYRNGVRRTAEEIARRIRERNN